MTTNENGPQVLESPRDREDLAGGEAAATVAQTTEVPREPLSARPLVLMTRGRVEYTAKCPGCRDWHRHVHLGFVTGPCGTEYELQPRRGRPHGK